MFNRESKAGLTFVTGFGSEESLPSPVEEIFEMNIKTSRNIAASGFIASGETSPGFKIDISRSQRVGRVSSEWFSRPDDERYLSLSELYGAV